LPTALTVAFLTELAVLTKTFFFFVWRLCRLALLSSSSTSSAACKTSDSGFVQIVPKKSGDADKLAKELNAKDSVWKTYVAPRPVPAMPSGTAAGSRNLKEWNESSERVNSLTF